MAKDLFFERTGMNRARVQAQVDEALKGADDGELYLEFCQSESFAFDDNRLKAANFDTTQGFGLRSVCGEATGFAHANELSEAAIARAAKTVQAVAKGHSGVAAAAPARTNVKLYADVDPLETAAFEAKVKLLEEMNAYARAKDSRVRQVSCSLAGEWQTVEIIRAGGETYRDVRPLVRLYVGVVVEENGRQESGSHGGGGRGGYETYLKPEYWQAAIDEALRQALVNLESIPAPAGEMTVVLGPGWPGILLHEAIGHGLEGDFNRKQTSAFSGLLGQRVAAPGVTVVDDGTIGGRRGSLTIDDEGTPSSRTVLIEDGILKGYMQDRQNARLMGMKPTGNGRRESYSSPVMPRMTNTYMLAGDKSPEEILASVNKGIYAVNFGGGQVDITNGKFVFSCTEAYLIENGKLGAPIKGATLIGNGPDCLTRVTMIGNDLKLDPGVGTCGKNGQSVPVGVGQPTLRLDGLTVGGTAA
ncbi:metalloprotease TldD [Rhizomicrobium electricum]|uniref:Metalloprotease TldD n=1 Tax=Rhizomicrobium electricum TaxID=480070 RepID=A0ABN1E675_9PROT|nr:metalloprotease TldD [Rhizomicrobium electricum]NIJ47706.1 TldD protein [Rhizomicrobium electricum]